MGITIICGLIGYHLSNWQGKCVHVHSQTFINFVTTSHKWEPPIRGYLSVQNTKIFSGQILWASYKQPPLMLFRVKLFWERLLEKMCTQQSWKYGIWYDQYTVSWHCSCWTYFCCVALLLTNIHVYHPWSLVPLFLISLNNSELKTTHKTFRDCHMHFFRQPFSK